MISALFDSLLHDPIGRWFIYVGVAIGIVVIIVGSGLFAYFKYVKPRLIEFSEKLDDVKHNVVNDHTVNMRDDQDNKHGEIMPYLASIAKSVGALQDGQVTLTKSTQNLYSLIVGNTADIEHLQTALDDTHTREQVNRIVKEYTHDGRHTLNPRN